MNPTDVLFDLANLEDIHLNLTVFEKDLASLQIGQKLIAYTNSEPNKKYPCEILLVSKDIANDRSAEVHCHFEKYDKLLLPGMYMNAEIYGRNRLAYIISETAVVSYEGMEYVFLVETETKFLIQEVKTGIKENGNVEIVNANQIIEKNIVTEGAYTLLMAMKNKTEN